MRFEPKGIEAILDGEPVPFEKTWEKGRRCRVAKIGDPNSYVGVAAIPTKSPTTSTGRCLPPAQDAARLPLRAGRIRRRPSRLPRRCRSSRHPQWFSMRFGRY